MTAEPAPLELSTAQRCFFHRPRGMCSFGGGGEPCRLCPNWTSKDLSETWFDLPGPVKARTGIQQTFPSGYSLVRSGDDAAAGAQAATEPAGDGGGKSGRLATNATSDGNPGPGAAPKSAAAAPATPAAGKRRGSLEEWG